MNKTDSRKSNIPFTSVGDGSHVIVFVHGFMDAGEVWNGVVDAIEDKDLQKVYFDLPGMGALSDMEGEITLDNCVKNIASVVEEIGKPFVIVGQSMGAQIAELVAQKYPDLARALVLLTPVPLGGVKAPAEMVAPLKQLGGQPEAERVVRKQFSPRLTEEQLDFLVGFSKDTKASVIADYVDVWNEGHSSGNAPSGFTRPVLVLRGTDDLFVNNEMVTGIIARFSNVSKRDINEVGHWMHAEQPKTVAYLISQFLRTIDWKSDKGSEVGTADWENAFVSKSQAAFGNAFAENVVLEAAVLYTPVVGRENVQTVMGEASKIYEKLTFTNHAHEGLRQYAEWEAEAFGGAKLYGITIITRNEDNAIAHVAIHHRPLGNGLRFSATLGERLRDKIGPGYFHEISNK